MNADAAHTEIDELAGNGGSGRGCDPLCKNPGSSSSRSCTTPREIRAVMCSTNAIESLNARYRRAVKARGNFPTEQAAIECLPRNRSLDPTGRAGHGGRCDGSQL